MTNAEAISLLKQALAEIEWEQPMQYAAAIDKAIEALEAKDTNVLTKWRKFEFREPDEGEKANHPEWDYIIENTPDIGEEILVSNGRYVWKDEFYDNGVECYLDSGHEMVGCWWMPLPEPPEESDVDENA